MVFKTILAIVLVWCWSVCGGSVGMSGEDKCLYDTILEDEQYAHPDADIDSIVDQLRYVNKRWPNNTMGVYMADINEIYHPTILMAMEYLSNVTCVKFVNSTPGVPEVVLKVGLGCGSFVGYRGIPKQSLDMYDTCFLTMGVVMHELMHATGLYHHHSRPDRDEYIFVNESNIQQDSLHNYRKYAKGHGLLTTMGLPYDYQSILHYPAFGFPKDDKYPVITVIRDFPISPGQRVSPTRIDIAGINRYYECWDHYLGDDIPGAMPYKEWHSNYMMYFKPQYNKILSSD
ncbi:hypothetical protein OTU49_010716, partial [Cherax quadricarinatus]